MNAPLWLRLRESLWFFPSLAVIAGVLAGFAFSPLEARGSGWLGPLLYRGDAESARNLLATLLGALVTVTGVVLSITVVALQIASQQFSPRLLRRFLLDRGTQVAISFLMGSYGYLLATLQGLEPLGGAVPRPGVTMGLGLALLSLGMLVYFIHDITASIRVEAIMLGIERETVAEIRRIYPLPDDGVDDLPPELPADAVALFAPRSGYVQSVDMAALVAVAAEHDTSLRLRPKVGTHIAEGALLGWAVPNPVDARQVDQALTLGFERTMTQDVAFGLGQLVDMAAKALSPAVNDPRTAVEATHHLTVLLCELGRRRLGHLVGRDGDGRVRAVVERPSFDHYLHLACDQIRRYGAREPVVTTSLLEMLGDCSGCVHADRVGTLLHHVALIEKAAGQAALPEEVEEVRLAAAQARDLIGRLCRPPRSAAEARDPLAQLRGGG
jgi:uncharacterized membrane protein